MGLPISFYKFPLGFGGVSVCHSAKENHLKFMNPEELLIYAFEKGFRLFDTAPSYGFGNSEINIGNAFKNIRDQVFIVSKSGLTWNKNKEIFKCNTPQTTKRMLDQSLKTLNTDYIDLYMIHWPDKKVDIRRPLEIYAEALDRGVIRHAGLCNTDIEDLKKAQEVIKIDAVQSEYNLLNRNAFLEIQDYLKEKDISFMSWGTLDRGVFFGNANRGYKSKALFLIS